MVNLCCVCKLEAGVIANVSFHRIPKQEEIKLKWFKNIGREVNKYATVCSKHFAQEDFYYKEINCVIKRFLLPTAVPSLLFTCSNSNDCMQPSVSSNIPCNIDITNEAIQRNQGLTVQNSNVTSTNLLHNSESIKSTESTIHRTDNNSLYVSETENTQISIKREADKSNKSVKRYYNLRYIGDLRREDFTSDASWKIVKNFVVKSKTKQKTLNRRVNNLHKKVEFLQGLLNHLKKKQITFE